MKTSLIALICLGITASANLASAQEPVPPQKEHSILKQDVGVWNAKGKMWAPGAPDPFEFEGVETNEMVGDLWSITDFRGDFGGMLFHGHGHLGFNVDSKKYEGVWFDSTSPYLSKLTGSYDAEKKMLTTYSVGKDLEGNPKKGKGTIFYKDKDTRIAVMYSADPEGGDKMVKEMEIIYTRKK